MPNIHATCIAYQGKGILLIGASGCGKSDLALRMIMEKGAVLVADDRTEITQVQSKLLASCPKAIKHLLEVRGLGIYHFPVEEKIPVSLVVELVADSSALERLPVSETILIENMAVKKIKLYPFELSAVHKLALACDENQQAC